MEVSAAFPTTLQTPEHVEIAESLGYVRAWLYDTPQQSPDVWMTLALAAARTTSIGLGPGVLVPTLRHPMVNAAATAALAELAPGRVAVAFGTGFTGRRAMGQKKPVPWAYLADYVRTFRGLLRGETVTWEGAPMRMLHPEGSGAPRPVDVPVVIGALGPVGTAVAHELGDGLFATAVVPAGAAEFPWVAFLGFGTVLDEGETWESPRVKEAGGPGAVLIYHSLYESGDRESVARMPGGAQWLEVVERTPEPQRHLAVHVGHCYALNEADEAGWAAGGGAILDRATLSGTAADVRRKVERLAEQGVTEIVYQPVGDVRHELEQFLAAVG